MQPAGSGRRWTPLRVSQACNRFRHSQLCSHRAPPFASRTAPPLGAGGVVSIADDKSKTPYSYSLNLSVQREVHGGFTIETSYVGRLGRRLLQTIDYAMPLDLVDSNGGGDYFSAAANLEKLAYAGTPASAVPKIKYWEDMFPDAANKGASGSGTPGYSATQNIYNSYAADPLNASADLYAMDIFCSPGCGGQRFRYFSSQYVSLFSQSSIGTSSYNAGQVALRHSMSHGLEMDFSYTFSKSLDLGSSAERIGGQLAVNHAFSQITNTFNPRQNYGVSDFDVTHLIAADWDYELPFGHGKAIGAGSNKLVNGVIGGWQFAGLGRWTSGLPFSTPVASGTVTAVVINSYAVPTGPISIRQERERAGIHFEWPTCRSRQGCWCSVSAYRGSGFAQQLSGRWLLRNRFRTAQELVDSRAPATCVCLGSLQYLEFGSIRHQPGDISEHVQSGQFWHLWGNVDSAKGSAAFTSIQLLAL